MGYCLIPCYASQLVPSIPHSASGRIDPDVCRRGRVSDEKETDWVGHLLGGRQVSRAVFMLANNRHSLCLSLCRSKQSVKHFQATLTEKGVKFGGKDFPTAEGFADHFRINVIIGDESGSKLFSLQCKESCSIFVLTRDCRRMPSSVSTRDNRIW